LKTFFGKGGECQGVLKNSKKRKKKTDSPRKKKRKDSKGVYMEGEQGS